MAAPLKTQATAQEIKPGESMPPVQITVNDRAATREAIIRKVRSLKTTFVERSSWGALKGKTDMAMDWDYTMIALHHAGRSHSCSSGAEQMQEIQKGHMSQRYDDIGYHYGIDCTGQVFEGRDIRLQGSSVLKFNTGLIGIVLLENLTTPEEGNDWIATGRSVLDSLGYSTTSAIPEVQITALMHLIQSLKSVFVIKNFGGHREYPGQGAEGKICPGNIGMKLVRNIRTETNLLPPPAPQE
ncbi:N-acetylmuramoyl-L-alanine amidase [Pseudomonas lijiangensis]|uniref:N-acetylmuramoyl-L-alanine amidase n=1 Tax=Pseudomonas lijiangensis TaxID=2995658 RepID=UPI0031BAAFEE